MEKYLNKFYNMVDKIGKHNFILIVFIVITLITAGLYQTFSLYTESGGVSILDDIETYSFILNASNETNSVTIASGNSKYLDITVSNASSNSLKYGLYYEVGDASGINIGYKSSTNKLPNGVITGNSDYVLTIQVDNLSEIDKTITFGVLYGFENGSDLILGENAHWLGEYREPFPLSTVEVGSYVAYTGNNGCEGEACNGQNANYVNDTNMGYCNSSSYKFSVNGWRVGYIENSSAYLVSAGAPECVNTYVSSKSSSTSSVTISTDYYYGSGYTFDDTTGKYSLTGVTESALAWSSNYSSIIENTPYTCKSTSSTGTCTTLYEIDSYDSDTTGLAYSYYRYEITAGVPLHLANLNNTALKYCNSEYVKGGVCDSSTAWAMNAGDFEKITGSALSLSSCYSSSEAESCGYNNDLIDNGGYYWFATPHSAWPKNSFYWIPANRYVLCNLSNYLYGLRPVLYLDSSVVVTGGSGTYEDPYMIYKPYVEKDYLSDVEVGSYVAYTGGNGSTGENVSDGYCYNSEFSYDYSGFRIGYIDGGSAHLVTGGAPECLGLGSSTVYVDSVASGNATSTSETWTQSSYATTYKYYYGSTYSFDQTTGVYSLSGSTTQFTISYSSSSTPDYETYPYTCKSNSSATATCTTIYKVTGYSYSAMSGGKFTASSYTSTATTVGSGTVDDLMTNLNTASLSYCNDDYAYNGTCDSNSAWAINGNDYNKITGLTFTNGSASVSDAHGIIGNGGFYWFNNLYNTSNLYLWDPSVEYINNNVDYTNSLGVRPVIKLSPNVYITGGSGTADDPYTIEN